MGAGVAVVNRAGQDHRLPLVGDLNLVRLPRDDPGDGSRRIWFAISVRQNDTPKKLVVVLTHALKFSRQKPFGLNSERPKGFC